MDSLVHWLRENVIHPIGILQIGLVGITYLIARFVSIRIRKHLEKNSQKVTSHARFALNPAQFSIVLGYALWLFLLWFCWVLFENLEITSNVLHMAVNLAVAWAVVHFAYFYIKNTFWSRLVYIIILVFLALKVFGLWDLTVKLLGSMTIGLGNVNVSVWGLIEAAAIFMLLWAASGAINRFVAHRLVLSDRLTVSDRILLQRVIRAATVAAVVLISLRAAGLDLTTLAVTGGAIGFAIGIGNVKDAVLSEIWNSFHANGIEIAFPQRDLHIKDAVPLKIVQESRHEHK